MKSNIRVFERVNAYSGTDRVDVLMARKTTCIKSSGLTSVGVAKFGEPGIIIGRNGQIISSYQS